MKYKKEIRTVAIFVTLAVALGLGSSYLVLQAAKSPGEINRYGSLVALTPDQIAASSDLIVEGEVIDVLPSTWNTSDGKEPDLITDSDTIYTDNIIKIISVVKGDTVTGTIKVRSYQGEVATRQKKVKRVTSDIESSYQKGEKVILFLTHDVSMYNKTKATDFYVPTGHVQGKYTLNNGKAESISDKKSVQQIKDIALKHKNDTSSK